MEYFLLSSALISITLVDQCTADICFVRGLTPSLDSYIYCSHGCCGYSDFRSCCDTTLNEGAIIGIVLGTLFALFAIIALIISCCRKSRSQPLIVMQPGQRITVDSPPNHEGQSYQEYNYYY